MKKQILFIFVVILCASQAIASTLSPALQQKLSDQSADSLISVVIFLEHAKAQNELATIGHAPNVTRSERIKQVYSHLTSQKNVHQASLVSYLGSISVGKIRKHWIVPALTVTVPSSAVNDLASQNGVELVVENVQLVYESPVEIISAPQTVSTEIATPLIRLNIPYLWQRGLKGNGSLICSFDTGVQSSHDALSDKWRGNNTSLSESWFSKVKPDSLPFDATGHGTHTMGIMVGATPSDSFGVAPEAEWITAGVIDQGRSLSVTIADILDAFQWALNPDGNPLTTDDVPDVILNSWGIPKGLFQPCDATFWTAIDNVEAAGIVTIFAAGNEGPNPMTLRSPADRASTPINSFAVGAVDGSNVIGSFSSRGPSSCDTTQIKPEVVAPGVSIRSCTRNDAYAYMTGTSMAAPYLAGMVALLRQYNPDVTVEEIKNAFISAANDLGPIGEDNAYGHGIVDASKLLNYIPSPVNPEFSMVSTTVLGDGVAMPGETFEIRLTLNNPVGNVSLATGTIQVVETPGVTIIAHETNFYFGVGGTVAVNIDPYEIQFDSSLYHGQVIPMLLTITESTYGYSQDIYFELTVGLSPNGSVSLMANNSLSCEISDFGQFGFAPNSMYNLNKSGFTFNNSGNLLYEAGLIIGRSNLQMAKSIRSGSGELDESDFLPQSALSLSTDNLAGSVISSASFNDANTAIRIPIDVNQKITTYHDITTNGFMLFEYELVNNSNEILLNVGFGFLADFDLSQNDTILYDPDQDLLYQTDRNGTYVGLVGLKNINGYLMLHNESGKTGYTNSELYSYISLSGVASMYTSGDMMTMLGSGKFSLSPSTSYETAFAIVVGSSFNELYNNVLAAKEKYNIATDINDLANGSLPEGFELYQNYPNPFNPTTTIKFSLPKQMDVCLEVINMLGQRVKTLIDEKRSAGTYEIEWDATADNGQKVASGIYFYRLVSASQSRSQKMILLK